MNGQIVIGVPLWRSLRIRAVMHASIIACSSILAVAPSVVRAEDDQVYMKRGAGINGQVLASTPTQVAVESRGETRKIDVNQIRLITFGDEPQDLRVGRAAAVAGNCESAIDDLRRVDESQLQRDLVKQDLQFYRALCLGRTALTSGGDKQAAADAMLSFVRAAPNSYHFFEAARMLGDLAVGRGDFADAAKFYGAIASKAPWPEYKIDAALLQADALVAQGEFSNALEKYDSVLNASSDTPQAQRQKALAQIGKGKCLAETGQIDEGIKLIEDVIANHDSTDGELFGRAYNALGDCLLKAEKPKDALMAYLHVDVLFYSDPDVHAESLYHLAQLWEALNKPDRAATARNLLQKRYAGSLWAQRK